MSWTRKIYRYLLNSSVWFTGIQVSRLKDKFPAKLINVPIKATSSTKIHFVHRYLTSNTGDMACGYYQYFIDEFREYECWVHDVNAVDFKLIRKSDVVIVGGGGLLNACAEWNYNINKSAIHAGRSVIWAAGFNANKNSGLRTLVDLERFDLVSVRDFNYGNYRYVPCATIGMSELKKKYIVKRPIGVLAHKDVPEHLPKEVHGFDSLTNNASLKDMVRFIGESEVILTNSYHAVYWSTLLKRKVILFAPRSEKYNYFKYAPVVFSGDLRLDIKEAKVYTNTFSESMRLNLKFLDEIRLLINKMPC